MLLPITNQQESSADDLTIKELPGGFQRALGIEVMASLICNASATPIVAVSRTC
jgi:hypothetical protein